MRAALLALLAGCGGAAAPAPSACDEAPVTTWDNFTAGFLTQNCQVCHAGTAPDRHGAPDDVTFDTEEDAWRWADALRRSAVEAGAAMPPGGGVSEDDRWRLGVWLDCGG